MKAPVTKPVATNYELRLTVKELVEILRYHGYEIPENVTVISAYYPDILLTWKEPSK